MEAEAESSGEAEAQGEMLLFIIPSMSPNQWDDKVIRTSTH